MIEGYREKCDDDRARRALREEPFELDIPIYITGMSFGALSLEAKMALAKGVHGGHGRRARARAG